MFVRYSPEDSPSEVQEWEFRPGRVRASRAAMIERLYSKLAGEKKTWDEFQAGILGGAADARRVLLWHLQSMVHPTLRIEDVDPLGDELTIEHSRQELEDLRAEAVKAKNLDEATRNVLLAKLDADIETARDDGMGKAISTTSASATS